MQFTNFINNIGIGIRLKTASVIVYQSASSSGNLFATDTADATKFLTQLSKLSWASVCLAHAFTRQTFGGGVLGLAYVGTLCQQSFSVCGNICVCIN